MRRYIPAKFTELKDKFGKDWAGAMGTTQGVPGHGECQRLMSGAKSLVYYGHGRFLSYVPPSAVACVDLSHCAVAVLACGTSSVEAQRRQVRLDNRKSPAARALEEPYQTAALLSMRGVDTVVLPTFASSTEGNAEVLRAVLGANTGKNAEGGTDVSKAVWMAGAPKPAVEAAEGDAGEGAAAAEPGPPNPPFSQFNFVVYGVPSVRLV